MDIIRWANGKGHTLVLAPSEVPEVERVLQDAERSGHGEGKDFDIDVSPILDEEKRHEDKY